MSRKYLNEKWCVRCGRTGPTPYLKQHYRKLVHNPHDFMMGFSESDLRVLDLGCGNGRNTEFMKEQGYTNVAALDMVGDYGCAVPLGKGRLPVFDSTADIVLANFVFMFLNQKERKQLIREIKRVARSGCTIMVELYPAKDSFAPTDEACVELLDELFDQLNWTKILKSKYRFIAKWGSDVY